MSVFDFLQGASNSAASTVSGPVDLLSLLLRKAGAGGLIGPAPVGSSAWMEKKGLTKPANGMAGLFGEAAGMSLPIVAAAKAPQMAAGLLRMGENLSAPTSALNAQRGAIVYHGSPHKFDRFDASKIGTGEGAQAYGHGIYLAETPEVAKSYTTAGVDRAEPMFVSSARNAALDPLYGSTLEEKVATLQRSSDSKAANYLRSNYEKLLSQAGNIYKVDLPDDMIARMLDWDKPLSQQAPDVQLALEAMRESAAKSMPAIASGDPAGRGVYSAYQAHRGGNQAASSERLRELGIPGIRYLDGGSRGAGVGTSNFVVFPGEEQILRILSRNGTQP